MHNELIKSYLILQCGISIQVGLSDVNMVTNIHEELSQQVGNCT